MKPAIPPKSSTSTIKKESPKPSTSKKSKNIDYLKRAKSVLKSLGYAVDEEGGYSLKSKSKKYPKAKQKEGEELQEGWEDWDYPSKRQLEYDTDSD